MDTGVVRVVGENEKMKRLLSGDGMEPSVVSMSTEKRKADSQMQFVDGVSGEQLESNPVAEKIQKKGSIPKVEEVAEADIKKVRRSSKKNKPELTTELPSSSVTVSEDNVSKLKYLVTYILGNYVKIKVRVTDAVTDGTVIMVFTPLSSDTQVEPPNKEIIEMSIVSLDREESLFDGKQVKVFCTGIYIDLPSIKSRLSVFFKIEE